MQYQELLKTMNKDHKIPYRKIFGIRDLERNEAAEEVIEFYLHLNQTEVSRTKTQINISMKLQHRDVFVVFEMT